MLYKNKYGLELRPKDVLFMYHRDEFKSLIETMLMKETGLEVVVNPILDFDYPDQLYIRIEEEDNNPEILHELENKYGYIIIGDVELTNQILEMLFETNDVHMKAITKDDTNDKDFDIQCFMNIKEYNKKSRG